MYLDNIMECIVCDSFYSYITLYSVKSLNSESADSFSLQYITVYVIYVDVNTMCMCHLLIHRIV